VNPCFREVPPTERWEIAAGMPPVFADQQKLMQVFLNLAKNSERALQGWKSAELRRYDDRGRVIVRFYDKARTSACLRLFSAANPPKSAISEHRTRLGG
jgi:hypothetical protein